MLSGGQFGGTLSVKESRLGCPMTFALGMTICRPWASGWGEDRCTGRLIGSVDFRDKCWLYTRPATC